MTAAPPKPNKIPADIVERTALYAFLILGSVVMLTPLVWMVSTASKSLEETLSPRFYLIPQHF